jgi:CDP-diacylglycerol--serine O-phosphatidyltransferase
MVSNVRYYSGKDINLRKSVPFVMVVSIALGFALIYSYPPGVLFALFLAYGLSGHAMAAWRLLRRKPSVGRPQ